MDNQIVQLEGAFAIWSYTIGHGRLLLRRTKTAAHPRRADVLFKDAGWICLPSSMEGVTIAGVSFEVAGELLAKAGPVRTNERKLFKVEGAAQEGFVLAGAVVWVEDDGEYHDPTSLLE
jgi:hypothetical protein